MWLRSRVFLLLSIFLSTSLALSPANPDSNPNSNPNPNPNPNSNSIPISISTLSSFLSSFLPIAPKQKHASSHQSAAVVAMVMAGVARGGEEGIPNYLHGEVPNQGRSSHNVLPPSSLHSVLGVGEGDTSEDGGENGGENSGGDDVDGDDGKMNMTNKKRVNPIAHYIIAISGAIVLMVLIVGTLYRVCSGGGWRNDAGGWGCGCTWISITQPGSNSSSLPKKKHYTSIPTSLNEPTIILEEGVDPWHTDEHSALHSAQLREANDDIDRSDYFPDSFRTRFREVAQTLMELRAQMDSDISSSEPTNSGASPDGRSRASTEHSFESDSDRLDAVIETSEGTARTHTVVVML